MINWTCIPFDDFSAREWYEINTFREQVFIVEQYCPYLDADGKDLKAHHLIGRNEAGDLLAYARLLPKGVSHTQYTSIGRILTTPKARGTGAGRQLIEQSIIWIEKLYGNIDIKIGAQCYLKGFYSKFGFEVISEDYLEDAIPHVDMIKKM